MTLNDFLSTIQLRMHMLVPHGNVLHIVHMRNVHMGNYFTFNTKIIILNIA
jgi:hypothetical protein